MGLISILRLPIFYVCELCKRLALSKDKTGLDDALRDVPGTMAKIEDEQTQARCAGDSE